MPQPMRSTGTAECTRPLRATVGQVESALADVLALPDRHLLDLGGTYGDPSAGDPIQYDELRIEHDRREVEIVVYDRAILLFTDDCEAVRRIHQVCAAGAGTEVRCRTIARSGFAPSHGGIW